MMTVPFHGRYTSVRGGSLRSLPKAGKALGCRNERPTEGTHENNRGSFVRDK